MDKIKRKNGETTNNLKKKKYDTPILTSEKVFASDAMGGCAVMESTPCTPTPQDPVFQSS